MLSLTAIWSIERGFIFMTAPPGLMLREVLTVMLGIRGDCTTSAEPGTRPKLERCRKIKSHERERERGRGERERVIFAI